MQLQAGNLDDQIMSIAAHRYSLGQQSYIVGSCLNWLYATWHQFDRNTQRVMIHDTIKALMDDLAGSRAIDAPAWRSFAAFGFSRLNEEDQQWLRFSVTYKNKRWPLEDCVD